MSTTEFSQKVCTNYKGTKKVVAAIGRWMPVHNGHKKFLVDLAKNYDRLIIMIGSCYQGGDIRHCISTTEREKMLRAIMKREKIPDEKFDIIPIPDFPTFDEWIREVTEACKKAGVTHFCSGNKEEITNVLKERDDNFDMEIIDPEENTDFPYHATDIRNMIINGEYEKLQEIIPDEIKPILFQYSFKEILAASENRGISYIEGRQAVDMVLLVKDITDSKIYVLLGNRPMYKKDFPGALALPGGGIERFETPINAAIRKFYDETGLKVKLLDNSLEPAIIKFESTYTADSKSSDEKSERSSVTIPIEQLCRIGIYGTKDEKLNGTMGGSSECFGIFVEGDLNEYKKLINSHNGLTNVKFYDAQRAIKKELAYQQNDMLRKAVRMFESQGA